MSVLVKLFRATLVLPFSAGNPRNRDEQGRISHDGSISGLVFLVSAVVILCLILIIGSAGQHYDSLHVNLFIETMSTTAVLAIAICVALSIYATIKPDIVVPSQRWDISGKIMLSFLWLFTAASLSYSGLCLGYHIDCQREGSNTHADYKRRIACDIVLFLFRLIQTGFLSRFSKCVFKSSLVLYYSLLILFLTNISVIVIDFAGRMRHFNYYTLDKSNRSFHGSCNSSMLFVLIKTEHFLGPAVVEYSLLTILFVSEIWSKSSQHFNRRRSSCLYDSIDMSERTFLISHANETPPINIELGRHSIEYTRRRTWKCINVLICLLLTIPGIVLFALKIHDSHNQYIVNTADYWNGLEMTIYCLMLIKGFYLVQTECIPTNEPFCMKSKEYLILVSFIGSLGYYTMRLIPSITMVNTDNGDIINIYNFTFRIIGIYFQTVFICQMKNYRKSLSRTSWMSIENTCLFLSVFNFMMWGVDSFLAAQHVFVNDAPTLFYGKTVWYTSYSILFPFVIFYRFKCFVAFFGLYHRLVSD